jgi:hypothetical protein
MKVTCTIILLGIILCFAVQNTRAAVYLSNLGETPSTVIPSSISGQNLWLAQTFHTGAAAGGYSLDSVQLSLNVTGSPSGNFSVYVYGSTLNGGSPTTPLSTLTGPNPTTSGTYTFNASGFSLSPSTFYWVVATTTANPAANPYSWNVASDYNYATSDNWSIPQTPQYLSLDGSTWPHNFLIVNPFQFAVNATAVPEPGVLSLAGFGLALTFLRRRI